MGSVKEMLLFSTERLDVMRNMRLGDYVCLVCKVECLCRFENRIERRGKVISVVPSSVVFGG